LHAKFLDCRKVTRENTRIYSYHLRGEYPLYRLRTTKMALKPGPKPIADSTGKPDRRRRDNKKTPGNTPGLKPSKSSKK